MPEPATRPVEPSGDTMGSSLPSAVRLAFTPPIADAQQWRDRPGGTPAHEA